MVTRHLHIDGLFKHHDASLSSPVRHYQLLHLDIACRLLRESRKKDAEAIAYEPSPGFFHFKILYHLASPHLPQEHALPALPTGDDSYDGGAIAETFQEWCLLPGRWVRFLRHILRHIAFTQGIRHNIHPYHQWTLVGGHVGYMGYVCTRASTTLRSNFCCAGVEPRCT